MKRRKKNLYFGFGPGKPPSKRERQKSRKEFKSGVERKRKVYKSQREKESSTLFKQLQRDAKPQRAKKPKWTPKDEAGWQELLRSNPEKAHELVRQATMAKKKRSRKRKRNSRKGVMPAGLKAYWAKKRRTKAKRKNPKKRRARKVKRARVRRRRPMSLRVRNYRRPRRRRRANPRRKRSVKIIKTNLRKGTAAFNQFVAQTRAKYGKARVL